MGYEQNRLMSSFIKSHFSYCQLIWTICSRTFIKELNNIQEKCLRLTTNGYASTFNELLKSSHELSIHKTCINYFMIEPCKYLHGLSLELVTNIPIFVCLTLKIYDQSDLEWMQSRFALVSCSKEYPYM